MQIGNTFTQVRIVVHDGLLRSKSCIIHDL